MGEVLTIAALPVHPINMNIRVGSGDTILRMKLIPGLFGFAAILAGVSLLPTIYRDWEGIGVGFIHVFTLIDVFAGLIAAFLIGCGVLGIRRSIRLMNEVK